MARELARADLQLRPSEYLAIRAGAIIGAPIVVFLLGKTVLPGLDNPLALLVGRRHGLVGSALLGQSTQEPSACRPSTTTSPTPSPSIANALRAGASFLQAIELVVRETQPPISTEFNRVIREVNLGLPFEQALANMVRRVRSDDLELMATAITIQHQVGGNLAEILDSIAFTIRERIRIMGEIRTLTAQQRMSGYVVGRPAHRPGRHPLGHRAQRSWSRCSATPTVAGHPGRRHHPRHRRGHDGRRLPAHPPHRRHRGLAHGTPLS